MTTKKNSKKAPTKKKPKNKKGKRLTDEQKALLIADINASMSTGDLMKKHKVSDHTIGKYRKKILAEKKRKPVSALDLKKALDIQRIDSGLMYTVEMMINAQQRIEKGVAENPDKYSPSTQAKVAQDSSRVLLEIRNALIFEAPPDLEQGYTDEDVNIGEIIMNTITQEQGDEMFEKVTGKTFREISPKSRPGKTADKE